MSPLGVALISSGAVAIFTVIMSLIRSVTDKAVFERFDRIDVALAGFTKFKDKAIEEYATWEGLRKSDEAHKDLRLDIGKVKDDLIGKIHDNSLEIQKLKPKES